MLFDAAVASLLVGRLCGGRFTRLGDLQIRLAWAIIAGFALQAALMTATMIAYPPAIRYSGGVHLVSYLFLFAGLWANRRRRAFQVAALGVVLNFLVVASNGGHMPANLEAVRRTQPGMVQALVEGRSGKHVVMGPHTRLAFLADRYLLPRPYPRPGVFSPGDVPITIGVCALILAGMGAFGLRPPAPAQERAGPAAK